MSTLPGHRVDRACRVLRILGSHATPRVQAAYMRTIFNGWCTRGRFQHTGACRFGCARGHDSLEHFPYCPVVKSLLASTGTWPATQGITQLDGFMCMDEGSSHIDFAVQKGLSTCALYHIHNGIRHNFYHPSEFQDAFHRLRLEGKR